ncbi:hypothetical protein GC087_21490 [Pantoea sp. JZ2]|uniref:hypothetical protein n=1 Tax=Pantoea sp. JZ2 TaxID=2654189 RepID=UPI002B49D617|nr:hypothetical protein [Pantoea sp. JZ2]WRH14984.1 hypothetical protein GC087_21490 [Pantoea sp. JZ2]
MQQEIVAADEVRRSLASFLLIETVCLGCGSTLIISLAPVLAVEIIVLKVLVFSILKKKFIYNQWF